MLTLLKEALEKKEYINSRNQVVKIHSETSIEQCDFLQQIIYTNKFKRSIEIGLAYGISTVAILEAIVKNLGSAVALDPFQKSDWGDNGLDFVQKAGFESALKFHEEYSYKVLPEFLKEGRQFDFAYIDSTKLFDWLMVDFFYLDKLIEINGIIVFDDVPFPGIRKLIRYLSQLPHYKVYGQQPKNKRLSSIRKILIRPFVPRFALKDELCVTDYQLGINTWCVALQKVDEDKRRYDWHLPF